MRKNYVKVSVVGAVMALMLTGCGSSFPDLTQEEEKMVGEYAATILLKYDANNRSRLVSREEAEEREIELQKKEEEKEQKPEGMNPVDDTPVIDIGEETEGNTSGNLDKFYELSEGVTITYLEEKICDSYPEEGEDVYLALDASEGKKLLVLSFSIENQSQTEQKVDLLSKDANIRVTFNNDITRNVLTTMLLDDMSTYVGNIMAGEKAEVVLLAEVDEEIAQDINIITLNFKNESATCTIRVK